MPSPDYFALTGASCSAPFDEITNALRTSAYMVNGLRPPTYVNVQECGCDALPSLLPALCGGVESVPSGGYTTPAIDNAPWYDPTVPESALFAGLLIDTVEGLDRGSATRTVTRLQGGRASLGPLMKHERAIDFEGTLHGASCCAVAYGQRWLNSVLARWCGGDPDCAEADLLFLEGCPETAATACLPGAGIDEAARSPWRRVGNVGLTEGPVVIERYGQGCGSCGCSPSMRVRFTLTAGDPDVYSLPTTLASGPLADDLGDNCLDLKWQCGVPEVCPTELAINDPACGNIPPPPVPLVPSSCYCEPLAAMRTVVPVTLSVPRWSSAVASVRVSTGAAPLRNVSVSLYRRDGAECGEDPSICDLLAASGISYIAPNSTLTVDSTRRRAVVDTPDGRRFTGGRFLYPAFGSTRKWLEMPCGGDYCIVVDADAFNPGLDATFTVDVQLRDG